jgi:hypothetical protein
MKGSFISFIAFAWSVIFPIIKKGVGMMPNVILCGKGLDHLFSSRFRILDHFQY